MKTKLVSFLLVCTLAFLPVLATAEIVDSSVNIHIISKDIVEKDFENQINAILEERKKEDILINPTAGDYIYTSEVVSIKTKVVSGYAGNQLSGGYQFPTGGGFFFSDSGGPEVSGSINFDTPVKIVSFSVGLGNKGTTGQYITAPNKTDYFKLYVSKTVEIRQVNIYRQITENSPKILDSIGYPQSVIKMSLSAKKVS